MKILPLKQNPRNLKSKKAVQYIFNTPTKSEEVRDVMSTINNEKITGPNNFPTFILKKKKKKKKKNM